MQQLEFRLPAQCDLNSAEALIERVCTQRDLRVGMKGSLAGFPGCIHWHLKKLGEKGTLEITLYPKERRIWAQVQDRRKAAWIDSELPILQHAIERNVQSPSSENSSTLKAAR